jgi:alkylhydroperoxidase family enzyme
MTAADVEGLRRHGLDDEAIHHVVQVTALFNYYNRLADGLGIDLEPEMPPRGPRADQEKEKAP